MTFNERVKRVTDDICQMLQAKNASYGNSALDPICCFSKASALDKIKVRIDDKLSRIKRGSEYTGDDTINDLIGYLILLKLAKEDLNECNINGSAK